MHSLTQPGNEDIKALLKKHGISRQEAAALLHVSVHTLDGWTAPEGSTKQRTIPLAIWELLLLKLNDHPSKFLVDK